MSAEATYIEAQELEAAGKHGEAAGLYRELVRLEKDPRFHIAFGLCLQRLGHWHESARQLQRGIDLKPHYGEADARLFLAESLLKAGQKKKAIEQWKFVAAMRPEYPSYEAIADEARKRLAENGVAPSPGAAACGSPPPPDSRG